MMDDVTYPLPTLIIATQSHKPSFIAMDGSERGFTVIMMSTCIPYLACTHACRPLKAILPNGTPFWNIPGNHDVSLDTSTKMPGAACTQRHYTTMYKEHGRVVS